MTVSRTEQLHEEAEGLDARPSDAVLDILLRGQLEAAASVRDALPAISRAAELASGLIGAGGRLGYVAAGSSGLMALADGLELPGTYGIPRERVVILFPGGTAGLHKMVGGPEDDTDQAVSDVLASHLGKGDCVVGLSASGGTPYAVSALNAARARGARTVAIANNEGAPIFDSADVTVLLKTPPEVIAGSTRMGAATAQKIALNLFSTLMAIRLGHVHDGQMVNLRADNGKLRGRALRIIAAIAQCDPKLAESRLDAAGGSIKTAILLAAGVPDAAAARDVLETTGQKLRPALSMIEGRTRSTKPAA